MWYAAEFSQLLYHLRVLWDCGIGTVDTQGYVNIFVNFFAANFYWLMCVYGAKKWLIDELIKASYVMPSVVYLLDWR